MLYRLVSASQRPEFRFEKLKTEYLGVDADGDVRNEYVTPMHWVKPGTLTLEQFSIFRGGAGDAKIEFTVRFDGDGKFHVISKKKIQEIRDKTIDGT
jgi:hypothetical protein